MNSGPQPVNTLREASEAIYRDIHPTPHERLGASMWVGGDWGMIVTDGGDYAGYGVSYNQRVWQSDEFYDTPREMIADEDLDKPIGDLGE
jgi:hypothetical protein